MKDILLEGNNGGDYIKITQSKKQEAIETCYIEVGSCCVIVLRAYVPVSFVTQLFNDFMLTRKDGMGRQSTDSLKEFAKEILNYDDEEYKTKLLNQIKEVDFLGREKL